MTTQRIAHVRYLLPSNASGSQECFELLKQALKRSRHRSAARNLELLPVAGPEYHPITSFELHENPSSEIRIDLGDGTAVACLGAPIFSDRPENWQDRGLGMGEFVTLSHGRLLQVDHTGIVIPADRMHANEWDLLKASVSLAGNLYRYPSEEAWPFLFPSTEPEFASEITEFNVLRHPKFELVYTDFPTPPVIQIDLETNFSRQETERLFPEPHGTCFPGLEGYFRSVFVRTPWPGFALRFDLRYDEKNRFHSWSNGKWVITEGGRIRS